MPKLLYTRIETKGKTLEDGVSFKCRVFREGVWYMRGSWRMAREEVWGIQEGLFTEENLSFGVATIRKLALINWGK